MSSLARRVVKTAAATLDRVVPPPPGITVLAYHRVGGDSGLEIDIPTGLFDQQMRELAPRAVPLGEALELLARDGAPAPGAAPVVVTFDDGTADFVDVALPILVRHRVPALLYVATDFVERGRDFPDTGRPVSWAGLADALATGLVTVGSHTDTHVLMDRLSRAEAERELDRSIGLLADRLGAVARDFAYPKAVMGSREAAAAVRARFRSAAVSGTRPNRYGLTDPQRLSRSPVQTSDAMRWFRHKAAGGMALEGSVRAALDRRRYAGRST